MGFYDAYAPSFQQKSAAPANNWSTGSISPVNDTIQSVGGRVQFGLGGHPTGGTSTPTQSVSGVNLGGGGSHNGGTSFGDFSGPPQAPLVLDANNTNYNSTNAWKGINNDVIKVQDRTNGPAPVAAPAPAATAPAAPVAPAHASYNDVNSVSQQTEGDPNNPYKYKQDQGQRAASFNAGATGSQPWPTSQPPAQGGYYVPPPDPSKGLAGTTTGVDTGNYSYGNGQRST